jgi:hypothetical protein
LPRYIFGPRKYKITGQIKILPERISRGMLWLGHKTHKGDKRKA